MSLTNFVTKISPFGTGFIACKGASASWAEVDQDVAKFTQVEPLPDDWHVLHWEDKSGLEWARKFRVVHSDIYFYEVKHTVSRKCETCRGAGEGVSHNSRGDEITIICPDCDGEGEL